MYRRHGRPTDAEDVLIQGLRLIRQRAVRAGPRRARARQLVARAVDWYPSHHDGAGWAYEIWLNLATVLGWTISTIFALSFTRLARST